MRYSLATLPSIFWLLASTCEAKPWGTYKSQDVGLDTVNETLWRRVRVPGGTGNNAPPPADQIFLFGPDNLAGGCSGQKSDIEAWLAEVRLIHNAVETLYSMITKPSVSKIWENFFGIFMRHNPDTNAFEIDPVSIQRWQQIGDHIARQTAKPDIYDLNTILRMTISIKQADKDAIPHNPETYVFLGMAAYIYLNPPEGKPAILYISGKSATEDAMWASVKRKREEGA
ncbi:hypothetical protein TrVFT333_007145 [Trichoderma virens FT-333]|nr:hypothetical protein TrVFT333_007145 [Trichoderma virens FT-333]